MGCDVSTTSRDSMAFTPEKKEKNGTRRGAWLLRVELDDQFLVDRQREVRPGGQHLHLAAERFRRDLEPVRHAAPLRQLHGLLNAGHLPALLTHGDRVAGADQIRWNVDLAP